MKLVRLIAYFAACSFVVGGMTLSNGYAQSASRLTFVMPNSPTPYLLAFLTAKDLGWYSKAGLDVEE